MGITAGRAALAASAAIVCLVAAQGTAAGAFYFSAVALTGTDGPLGPGLGAGTTFTDMTQQQPAINNAGVVAFRGNIPSGTSSLQGVYYSSASGNVQVAVQGGAMPGGGTYPTDSTGNFNGMQINNAGQWAFRTGASTGVFSGNAADGTGRVMLTGASAPGTGTPAATFSSVGNGMPLFNGAGQTLWIASLTLGTGNPAVVTTGATANAAGLWMSTPVPGTSTPTVSLVMRQNAALTSLASDGSVRVGGFASSNLTTSFNGAGQFVMVSPLQGTVTTGTGAGSNANAVLSNRSGSLEALARTGSAAPDAAGGASADLYRGFVASAIAFNDAGRVAFGATLRNAAGTQTSSGSLFSDVGGGGIRRLAQQGQPLPAVYTTSDTNAASPLAEYTGVTWGSSFSSAVINRFDALAFVGAFMGNVGTLGTDTLLLRDPGGALRKIARSQDTAIVGGAPDGSNARFLGFSNVALNALNQVAFSATLTGTGVSVGLGNGSSLWATDLDGSLVRLARTGDLFEVTPGVFRTVSSIGGLTGSGGADGRGVSLNDRSEVVFQLSFSDGSSGVFVARVPAPSGAALLGLAGLGAARRRRR